MKDHNEHEDNVLLSAYLDGQLTEAERARVEAQLSGCGPCREEVEALRYMKAVLAAAPRRAMPPELLGAIEDAVASRSWTRLIPAALRAPRVFVPAGALAALALVAGLWLGLRRDASQDFIPLEPLMTAHARYTAETLVPQGSLVSSTYSAQLTAQNDEQDQQAD
ncbi:MAG: zf-HC2 domain-containing protein [Elusimicrobia bacterium]|nr:zf-HC2 domain-containing protein [Elusimicrobiota bacterium]